MLVTDDKTGLSRAIVQALSVQKVHARLLTDGMVRKITESSADLGHASGLVIVQNPAVTRPDRELKTAFLLAKHTGPALLSATDTGCALFATITRLDGAFGFSGRSMDNPAMGGLAGLAKTASME